MASNKAAKAEKNAAAKRNAALRAESAAKEQGAAADTAAESALQAGTEQEDKAAKPAKAAAKAPKKKSEKKGWFANARQFFKDARAELKKVVWPTRKETRTNTIVVLCVVAVAAVFLIALDALFGGIIGLLMGA